jgi:hypothetical protein
VVVKQVVRDGTYARDARPWAGRAPPGVAYVYAPDRKHARPAAHLAGFSSILQVDGYGAYAELAEGGSVDAVELGLDLVVGRPHALQQSWARPCVVGVSAVSHKVDGAALGDGVAPSCVRGGQS